MCGCVCVYTHTLPFKIYFNVSFYVIYLSDANQYIRMISEGSYDSENWSNSWWKVTELKILIVSRQRHSSWNRSRAAALNALDVLKLSVITLSENRFRWLRACGREINESFKLIHELIHWFDQAFEQNWLKRMNNSRMSIAHCPEKSRQGV